MPYKVVSFKASIANSGTAGDVAPQVQAIIDEHDAAGWQFMNFGNVDTVIAGTSGCFGLGATAATNTSVLVLVFRK
jgi:hypothetical protein